MVNSTKITEHLQLEAEQWYVVCIPEKHLSASLTRTVRFQLDTQAGTTFLPRIEQEMRCHISFSLFIPFDRNGRESVTV